MFESSSEPKPAPPSPERGYRERMHRKLGRLFLAARDAFFEHADNPDAPVPWGVLADSRANKFDRTKALFSIVRNMVPDAVFKKLTFGHYEYYPERLPVESQHYQFETKRLDSGKECDVYRLLSLRPDHPSLVIKIDRMALQNFTALNQRRQHLHAEYNEKRQWYQEIPELIPEEAHFVGPSPRGKQLALLTLQEYFGLASEIHDLFQGYTAEELVALSDKYPDFQKTLLAFARITVERAVTHDEMVDTLGQKNVSVVDRPEGPRLILLDAHVVHHPAHPTYPGQGERIATNLNFLRDLIARLEVLPDPKSVPTIGDKE